MSGLGYPILMMNVVINIIKFVLVLVVLQISFYCLAWILTKSESVKFDKDAILKITETNFHNADDLKKAISQYYIAILNKDWKSVYNFRAYDIERLADEETFLAIMDEKMSHFSIEGLVFQMIEIKRVANKGVYSCRLVVRVLQNPGLREHTAVVNWSKETGEWKCDSFGLQGSSFLGPW